MVIMFCNGSAHQHVIHRLSWCSSMKCWAQKTIKDLCRIFNLAYRPWAWPVHVNQDDDALNEMGPYPNDMEQTLTKLQTNCCSQLLLSLYNPYCRPPTDRTNVHGIWLIFDSIFISCDMRRLRLLHHHLFRSDILNDLTF